MARPQITFTPLEETCTSKRWGFAGGPCGAHLIQVTMNLEMQALVVSRGVRLTDGERVCGNTGSLCGPGTGLRLKALLEALV